MTPAIVLLEKTKTPHKVHSYTHDPRAESYGEEAAHMLGVEPACVFKTLMVCLDEKEFAVGIVPVCGMLNLKRLAKAAGAKKAAMAKVHDVERVSGYVLGGVSPLGQKKRVRTFVDESAKAHGNIFVSAGRRGLEIELAPQDLVHLARGVFAPIAQED